MVISSSRRFPVSTIVAKPWYGAAALPMARDPYTTMFFAVSVRFFAVVLNSKCPKIVSVPSGGGETSNTMFMVGSSVTSWPAVALISASTDDHSVKEPSVPVRMALQPSGGH